MAVPKKETKESKPVLYRFGYDEAFLQRTNETFRYSGKFIPGMPGNGRKPGLYLYKDAGKNKTTNGICLLGPDLKKRSELGKLGEDENLMTSYFIDKIAYFVTYRTTDPVFVIDCSLTPARLEKKTGTKTSRIFRISSFFWRKKSHRSWVYRGG